MSTRGHTTKSDEGWGLEGFVLTNLQRMEGLKDVIEEGPLIIEHWHYRGSRGPTRFIETDWGRLESYIKAARPGDAFHFWFFDNVCLDDNVYEHGKIPDERGFVPKRGAY